MLAGVPGFEPGLSVLETDVLTVDTIPLLPFPIANCRFSLADRSQPKNQLEIRSWQSEMSFGFLMSRVLTAATAELLKLETFRGGLLILCSNVVATLAICTL